jgi:Kelch motif.
MRKILALIGSSVLLLAAASTAHSQTWKPLTHQPSFSASNAYLLTDGRVMVHDTQMRDWWALKPDSLGSYRNGTWSQLASLPSGYSPLYYAGAVLPDGRLVILGGEYNAGQSVWTNRGAVYDPKTNLWKSLSHPSGWTTVGDAQSVILANGTMMVANCCTTQSALLNASTLTWTVTGTGKADSNDEEGWTLLPSGEVLTVDATSGNTNSEIYNPATGKWSSAGSTW